MDWPPEPLAPETPLRKECWRLVGPSGRPVICTIEQAAGRYEVRVGRSDDDLIESRLARDLEHARAIADELRGVLLADGSFTEVGGASH